MKVRGKSQQKSTHSWPLLGTFSVPGAFVIILPNPHNSMGSRCCHPHFMDVKTEGQRQRVTVSGLTSRFQLRSAWLPPLQGTPRPPGASPHSLCPPPPLEEPVVQQTIFWQRLVGRGLWLEDPSSFYLGCGGLSATSR